MATRLVAALDKRFEHLAREHGIIAMPHAREVSDARARLEELSCSCGIDSESMTEFNPAKYGEVRNA